MSQGKTRKKIIVVQTLYGTHTAVLERDEKRGYIVTVPGLEGVITWGKNIAHAKRMAQEAIELCIECLVGRLRKTVPSRRVTSRSPRETVSAVA